MHAVSVCPGNKTTNGVIADKYDPDVRAYYWLVETA